MGELRDLDIEEIDALCENDRVDESVVRGFLETFGCFEYKQAAIEKAAKYSLIEGWNAETLFAVIKGIALGTKSVIEVDKSVDFDDSGYLELNTENCELSTGYEMLDFGMLAAELGTKLMLSELSEEEKKNTLLATIGSIADVLFSDVSGVAFVLEG